MSNLKKFKLGELFEFEAIKQSKSQREIPDDDSAAGVPYIVQSMFNNMFSRNVNKQWLIDHNEAPISGNRIVLGVTLPAVSYQSQEFGASQVITAKADWLDRRTGLYMVTVISKMMYQFSYSQKPGLQIYKKMEVELPISSETGEIDFEQMNNRIHELETLRIRELGEYLKAAELSDYILSAEEKTLLDRFREGGVQTNLFKIGDLFSGIMQGSRLTKNSQTQGNIPFVMSGTTNAGISNYISNSVEIFPKNSITVDIFGNTFYRDYEFGMGDDTGILWDKSNHYNKYQMMYFSCVIQKSLAGLFDYGHKLRSSQISTYEVHLPVNKNGNPDLDFMEKFIKIQQKLAIKNVVEWKGKQIEVTKNVIAR